MSICTLIVLGIFVLPWVLGSLAVLATMFSEIHTAPSPTCEHCGRDKCHAGAKDLEHCSGDWLCEFASEAYQRGVRDAQHTSADEPGND